MLRRLNAMRSVRLWNAHVPIGTPCHVTLADLSQAVVHTWSHAGLGRGQRPVVFVAEAEEPIPLSRLRPLLPELDQVVKDGLTYTAPHVRPS